MCRGNGKARQTSSAKKRRNVKCFNSEVYTATDRAHKWLKDLCSSYIYFYAESHPSQRSFMRNVNETICLVFWRFLRSSRLNPIDFFRPFYCAKRKSIAGRANSPKQFRRTVFWHQNVNHNLFVLSFVVRRGKESSRRGTNKANSKATECRAWIL